MTLAVCGIPASTATARVLTTIFEKDVEDYKIETVDITKGAQKEAAYLAIQVGAKVEWFFLSNWLKICILLKPYESSRMLAVHNAEVWCPHTP